jgi:hypothetical protein
VEELKIGKLPREKSLHAYKFEVIHRYKDLGTKRWLSSGTLITENYNIF